MQKKYLGIAILLLFIAFYFNGCTPDPIEQPTITTSALKGEWLSESTNIAPALDDSIKSIKLQFLDNKGYTLFQTNSANVSKLYSGTFTVNNDTLKNAIQTITFNQTDPSSATYVGIYEVSDLSTPNELSLEIVMTQPTVTYTPPTIIDEFGSTGELGVFNIQKYEKQP